MKIAKSESKEKFVLAAIKELQTHGITDFSMRRIAKECGMSSGAPYKHFKDKSELIVEAIKHICREWGKVQRGIIRSCSDDPKELLVEISVAYVKFLCENPAYQSILMLSDNSLSPQQLTQKASMTSITEEIIENYCESVEMNDDDRIRKTYAVRSFIFGAAYLINSGFFKNDEESILLARRCIEREFDII